MSARAAGSVLIALFYLHPGALLGQTGSMRVSVPSPTAASLAEFGDVPMSLYTGAPSIDIPLESVTGRTLSLPIGLRYHGGGIKVEEVGGWTGIGWALDAGGSITRTVRGNPDELWNGYWNTGDVFYTGSNWTTPSPSLFNDMENGVVDSEPDQWFFSFAGRSGQFLAGPTYPNGTMEYRAIPHQQLKIEPIGAITGWLITTEDGTEYEFTADETTTDISYNTGMSQIPGSLEPHTSTWHLTTIRAPGGDEIKLFYQGYSATHRRTAYEERFDQRACYPNDPPSYAESITESTVSGLLVDSIWAAGQSVKFHTSLRTDALHPNTSAQQEERLDSLVVTSGSGIRMKSYGLEYDYTGGRLRLRKVWERGSGSGVLPPYELDYQSGSLPGTESFAQDHWGYYNGKTTNSSLIPTVTAPNGTTYNGADRAPNLSYAHRGALTRITYPTGGYHDFTWELNDYGYVGGSSGMPTDTGPIESSFLAASGNQGTRTTTFTIGGTQSVPVTVDFDVSGGSCSWCIGAPWAQIVGEQTWNNEGEYTLTLSPGTYTLKVSDDYTGQYSSVTAQWQEIASVPAKAGGGLRVSQVDSWDGYQTTTMRYDYRMSTDPSRSSGVVNNEPQYNYQFSISGCSYHTRSGVSKMPLGAGPPVGYREVTVLQGATGQSYGKTTYEFTGYHTATDVVDPSVWPHGRPTSQQWKRGHQTVEEIMNWANQMQRRAVTGRAYVSSGVATAKLRGISFNSFSIQHGSASYLSPFEVVSGWTYAASEAVSSYNQSGGSVITSTTNYTYGNPSHAQLTQIDVTNGDGTTTRTHMRYADDYPAGGSTATALAVQAMKTTGAAHMPGVPLERWVEQVKSGYTTRILEAEQTTFKDFGSGRFLPYRRYTLDGDDDETGFTPSSISGSAITRDSRYELVETVATRDTYGRPGTIQDYANNWTTYGYGGTNSALLTSVNEGGLNTTILYTDKNEVSRITDPAGSYKRFEYDEWGRLYRRLNHAGQWLEEYSYVYSRTSANGWTFTPSAPNYVRTLQTRGWGTKESRSYVDGLGKSRQSQTLKSGSTWFVHGTEYDAAGRVWREWRPYERSTGGFDQNLATNATAHYGANSKPYTETTYLGDPMGRPHNVTAPWSGTTSPGSVNYYYGTGTSDTRTFVETTDETGRKTRQYTDALGRRARQILGHGTSEGTNTWFAYGVSNRNISQVIDGRSLQTNYYHNPRGEVIRRDTPDTGTTQYLYNRNGDLRFVQDAEQAAQGRVAFTSYDFARRPLTRGEGTMTWSALNADSNGYTFEGHSWNINVAYAYDAKPSTSGFPWNLFSSQIAGANLERLNGRTAAVASNSSGSWQLTLYSYDQDGYVNRQYTYTHAYDTTTVATNIDTELVITRDRQGSPTHTELTVGPYSFDHWFDYNRLGQLLQSYASNGSVKPSTPDVTYSYEVDGQIATRKFRTLTEVPFDYSVRGQLLSIGDPTGGLYPFSAAYTYNNNGTVNDTEYRNGTSNVRRKYEFTYDALNRLNVADYYSNTGSSWINHNHNDEKNIVYDKSGNITALQRYDHGGVLIDNATFSFQSGTNRLTSVSDAVGLTGTNTWDLEDGSYTYYADGNLKTAPAPYSITSVTYNPQDLPTWITANGVATNYRYDHAGQRIAKKVGSGDVEYYIRDGATVLGVFTLNSSGAITDSYFNMLAGGTPIGRRTNVAPIRLYYHTDMLGSTRVVEDAAGSLHDRYNYYPFGLLNEGLSHSVGTKEGFTGKERDAETQMSYFGARYYMPALGRWAAVDPLADAFPGWSGYNYVLGNPASTVDPDGRIPIPVAVMAIGGAAWSAFEWASTAHDASVAVDTWRDPTSSGGERVSSTIVAGSGAILPGGKATSRVTNWIAEKIGGAAKRFRSWRRGRSAPAGEVVDIHVPADRYPETAGHIRDAQDAGHPAELTIDRPGADANRAEALRGHDRVPDMDRDEYPPSMFEEGGAGASVRPVTPADNRGAGACIGNQCRGLPDGTRVRIVVDEAKPGGGV